MIYIALLVVFTTMTICSIYFYLNKINQNYDIMSIKQSLKHDYYIYKKCINTTNQITCGRSSSKIQKKEKKLLSSEDVLFSKPSNTISKNLKECDIKNVKYLIAIDTGADFFSERYVYREFYKRFSNIQFYFFTGISENSTINNLIERENTIYKDIVIFPFISSYHTLALTFVSEMMWVRKRCKNYKWLIHHQADVFVNIKKTIQMLNNTNCEECCIGQIKIHEKIYRSKNEMWYIPEYLYPNATEWPPYLNGPVIFFTNKSLEILSSLVGKVHPQYWVDDVYIGLLLQKTNISLIDIKLAYYPIPRISIEYAYSLYAVHQLTASELHYLANEYFLTY